MRRNEKHELGVVAAVERKLLELRAGDDAGCGRTFGIHAHRVTLHGDDLADRADHECEIDSHFVADVEHDAGMHDLLESLRLDGDAVAADGQLRDDVLSVLIGGDRAHYDVLVRVGNGDRCIRDCASCRIDNRSLN